MAGSNGLRQAWQRGTLALSALVVAGLVLAVIIIVATSDHKSASDGATGSPTAPTSATEQVVPAGYVLLPKPTSKTNGYPTGYPNTAAGAAALVAAFASSAFNPDYTAQEQLVKTYVTDQAKAVQLADEMAATPRQALGLPLTGQAPAGIKIRSYVDGIQWKVTSPTDVTVGVDMRYTFTLGNHQKIDRFSAQTRAVWGAGRWWISDQLGAADPTKNAYAAPGTAAFEDAGWQIVKNDDWMGAAR